MIDFRVFLSAPFLFIAVLVNIISFKTFVFISLFILCIAVLFEKWSSSGLRAVERRQKKRLKNDEKEQLSISNGMFSNMFFNRSFQEKSKTNKNNTSSTWKMGSTSPHVPTDSRIRNRCAVSRNHSFSGRRSDFNASRITDNHLKYIPFLPTVRRALGLDNVQNSPLPKTPEVAATYPERPVAGFLPAVRLGRRELPRFSPASRSLGRSPNTVKIAPPDPRRIYNTRLFQVKNNQREENRTSTPNTQSVLSALKEKSRKRTMDGVDVTISDVQGQMAKRRRQESQQSNASTSSLPSLPDNLPDLSTQGYTIPRLRTPTLKRSINMANLTDLDWEDSESGNIKKRPRHEAHYNSISSSLSSMRRMRIKQAVNKRKNESKENSLVEDGSGRSSPVMKKAMLQSADTIVLPENKDVPSPTYVTKDETSKSQLSELETSVADFLNKSGSTQKAVRTPKRVALTEKLSARKRDMSLYAGLNKTYENVPQANISAKIEDYDQDREEEEKRVQDLMSEIGEPEKDSGATSVVSSTSVLTTAASIPSQAATSSPSITLGSTKPVSNSDSTSTPASSAPSLVSASVSASTPGPGLFVTSAAVSTTSVSPVSKPLSTTGFTFSGFSSGANGMSSMVSLSSGTTTVTSAAGTIASASPFNLGTTSTSVAKTSPLTGFQVEQKTSKAESSLSESSSAPATFTQPGTLFSGSSSSTVSSTSAPPPPYFGGQTAAFASSPVGQGGLNSAVQTAKSSSVTSVLPSEGIKGGFSFGGQTTSPATTVTTAATSASVGGFAFGGQSQSVLAPVSTEATSTSKVGGFSFGGQTSIVVTAVSNVASSTSAVGGFNFGGTTTTGAITSSANGGFNFGSQSSTAPSAASAGGFSFNSQSSNATRASAPGGFNFGTTATSTLAGSNVAFSFGAGKDSSAASTSNSFMNKPSALVASASNANTVASTTPAPGGFNFGAQPTSSNGTKGFNFASQNPASAPKPATTTAAGVFAFGGQNASTAVSPSSGGFNFASGSTAPAGVFNFGTNKPATTTSGMFNPTSTTKSEQASTVFAFGAGAQNSTTPSSTSFGQQPAGSQPSSTFAFGQSTTTAGSVFGQPTVTQPTPVFGQSSTQPFGQNPQSQPPSYGSTTGFGQQAGSQTTTGFGQTSQSTSGFGQNASGPTFGQQPSAQPTFNFGQQNPNTQAAPAFGQTATQPSFAFGQQASCQPQTNTVFSFGQQTAPAFEQSTSASSFTKSASTPAFGSTNGNTGFNFGTTTPLKNSQSSAPSSGFSFGTPQNNSATPNHSTPANQGKGFDFSGSLTPSGSFNFGAGGNTFGTPGGSSASQPNFASTPSFNVGAGSNPQKPRPIRKPIRRTKR